MAMTLSDLEELLDGLELRYQTVAEHDLIMVGFNSDPDDSSYRDRDGDPSIALALRLSEGRGEFLSVFAPMAWVLGQTPHLPAVCETLVAIQSRFKMVKFDLAQGMIFPNVELPLEDGRLTGNQLQRVIGSLLQVLERFHVVVRRAIDTGRVSFDDVKEETDDAEEAQADRPASPAAGDIGRLLELVDEAGGMDGGGIDALERLLGGGDVPPIDA